MGEEINFGSTALAEYVTDANEILEFKLVSVHVKIIELFLMISLIFRSEKLTTWRTAV